MFDESGRHFDDCFHLIVGGESATTVNAVLSLLIHVCPESGIDVTLNTFGTALYLKASLLPPCRVIISNLDLIPGYYFKSVCK